MNKLLKYAIQRYGKVNTRRGGNRPKKNPIPTHTPHTKESVVKSIVADHLQKIMRK